MTRCKVCLTTYSLEQYYSMVVGCPHCQRTHRNIAGAMTCLGTQVNFGVSITKG